jgi:hypothetical protein
MKVCLTMNDDKVHTYAEIGTDRTKGAAMAARKSDEEEHTKELSAAPQPSCHACVVSSTGLG